MASSGSRLFQSSRVRVACVFVIGIGVAVLLFFTHKQNSESVFASSETSASPAAPPSTSTQAVRVPANVTTTLQSPTSRELPDPELHPSRWFRHGTPQPELPPDFALGEPLQINGQPVVRVNAKASAESAAGSAADALMTISGFTIHKDAVDLPTGFIFHAEARPVVQNVRNHRLGVISGTLVVTLSPNVAAEDFAAARGLRLLHHDRQLGLAYLRVPEGFDLRGDAEALARTGDVVSVETEIIYGNKEAW